MEQPEDGLANLPEYSVHDAGSSSSAQDPATDTILVHAIVKLLQESLVYLKQLATPNLENAEPQARLQTRAPWVSTTDCVGALV